MKYKLLFINLFFFLCLSCTPVWVQVRCGADRTELTLPLLRDKQIALIVNQTSITTNGIHLLDTLLQSGIHVTKIFAPEHGFRGTADAGEVIKNGTDLKTGLPIVSLYGKNKKPQPEQLKGIDAVVFDIQDVGARFYTYISTLYYVMQACAENDKELVVLDRPNPCDYVDGPVLKPAYKSFVGMLPIPVLHGCTMGEMAQMINGEKWLGNELHCNLTIVPVEGWQHGEAYSLPVKPSPNLPNDQAIALYPSLCPFEGTSVSVGRGTLHPFQVLGTPLLSLSDSYFRFIPRALEGFDKNPLHKDQYCYGDNLQHIAPPKGLSLQYVINWYQKYKQQHKENEFFTRPRWFDLLMGTDQVRKGIIQGKTEAEIRIAWQQELKEYCRKRALYLLYTEL
jgi:uncharacterized protein YbbC (DUF1343 family)